MSKEIKLLIQKRLKGFKVGIVQSDVDSFIFDTTTMLKIEELSKEFDMGLVFEVMQNKHYFANMTIDSIQAKREVESYRDNYPVDNISSREDLSEHQVSQEYGKRCKAEERKIRLQFLEKINSYNLTDNISSQAERNQLLKEAEGVGLFFEPAFEQQGLMKRLLMHGMTNVDFDGEAMTTSYRGSSGDGYGITTNGGSRKKVITGKAGNKYPVVKRRGVK